MNRLIIGLVIIAIVAPLTTYRATQLRLDERACFNQIRAAEGVEQLLNAYNVADLNELSATLVAQANDAQARFDTLDAISDRTSEQNSERTAARGEARDLRRNAPLLKAIRGLKT